MELHEIQLEIARVMKSIEELRDRSKEPPPFATDDEAIKKYDNFCTPLRIKNIERLCHVFLNIRESKNSLMDLNSAEMER